LTAPADLQGDEVERVEAGGEMPSDKLRKMDTDTKHEHESQCQSSKLGIPGKPEKRTLSEREFGQQTVKHRSKGTREYPGNFRKNGIGECFSTERENLTKNYQPGFSYH
jgi:hypothetical protein